VAVGAPVLTALTGRVPRKALLLGLMALFTSATSWPGRRRATAR
jgi:predicted MFS family arabinose efflux permease